MGIRMDSTIVSIVALEVLLIALASIAFLSWSLSKKKQQVAQLEAQLEACVPLEKVNGPSAALNDDEYWKRRYKLVKQQLESLRNQLKAQNSTIRRLKAASKNSANLDQVDALQTHNEKFEKTVSSLDSALHNSHELFLSTKKKQDQLNASPKTELEKQQSSEFYELSAALENLNQNYDATSAELEKLRQSNMEKRRIILELDASLRKQENLDSKEIDEIISALKIELRDSKMCTAVLESETDNLRSRIKSLQLECTILSDDNNFSLASNTKTEKNDQATQAVFSSLCQLSRCGDIKSISEEVERLSKQLNLPFLIQLNSNGKNYCLAEPELNTSYNRQVFEKQDLGENIWHELPQGWYYLTQHCQVLLCNFTANNTNFDLDSYAQLFRLADIAIERLDLLSLSDSGKAQQKKILDTTQRSIAQMEIRYNNILEQAREGLSVFNTEFEQFSASVDFSELQKDCISDMVNDLSTRMELLFESGKAMSGDYLELKRLLANNAA